ncbi:MAG: chemotaxis-specific protein-glutamate methyltransferase CheB [Ruminococcus sp.]|nr:chemotaxis-specific protein-glutamate methyltransferase CheB [Ruminococcus sp.]
MSKIRVLIVDDSPLIRQTFQKLLEADESIEVIATAGDAYEARDAIVKYKPDVMTLDIEMPRMNGIQFLKKLIPQFPLPVIVCSSLPINTFDALEAGAVDYVRKPVITSTESLKRFGEDLVSRVKVAVTAKVIKAGKYVFQVKERKHEKPINVEDKIIAIGGSTGATEALPVIVSQFDENTPPCVVVIHMPEGFTNLYAQRLEASCPGVKVMEAKSGMYVKKGMVVIAQGNKHMKVFKDSNGYFITCSSGKRVSGHCPSVDVMFESVAGCAKGNAYAAILTGMGSDGARGLLSIRNNGGFTVGQDEESCLVYGMPKVAFTGGAVCVQAKLEDIADVIYNKLRER